MTERPPVFHLAWHRRHIARCDSFLIYVLVPTWLGAFNGSMELQAISGNGRPLDSVRATMLDLASPRQPGDTEGMAHPIEVQLLRALSARAMQASYTLPEIRATLRTKGWARLVLKDSDRTRLLRAGGVLL